MNIYIAVRREFNISYNKYTTQEDRNISSVFDLQLIVQVWIRPYKEEAAIFLKINLSKLL